MTEHEFEENARLFEAGQISRRRFIQRMVAGGASMAAAVALVNASPVFGAPGPGTTANVYGTPPGQAKKNRTDIYGTPPGQGGVQPGKGGTPHGQAK